MIFKTYLYIPCVLIFTGNDTVQLGGNGGVRMTRNDFNYAKAAHKPIAMALRLVDALFTKEILPSSTVHGTKDYAPLDRGIMAAIRGWFNFRVTLLWRLFTNNNNNNNNNGISFRFSEQGSNCEY